MNSKISQDYLKHYSGNGDVKAMKVLGIIFTLATLIIAFGLFKMLFRDFLSIFSYIVIVAFMGIGSVVMLRNVHIQKNAPKVVSKGFVVKDDICTSIELKIKPDSGMFTKRYILQLQSGLIIKKYSDAFRKILVGVPEDIQNGDKIHLVYQKNSKNAPVLIYTEKAWENTIDANNSEYDEYLEKKSIEDLKAIKDIVSGDYNTDEAYDVAKTTNKNPYTKKIILLIIGFIVMIPVAAFLLVSNILSETITNVIISVAEVMLISEIITNVKKSSKFKKAKKDERNE